MAKVGFGKGDIVKVRDDAFGDRWDNTVRDYVPETTVRAKYYYTAADKERMREERRKAIAEAQAAGEDTFGMCFDDAGEPRLMGDDGITYLKKGIGYRVLRARCRQNFNYHTTGGWTKLLDLDTGREVFIKTEKLERVEA
jgi:hypothetical protein